MKILETREARREMFSELFGLQEFLPKCHDKPFIANEIKACRQILRQNSCADYYFWFRDCLYNKKCKGTGLNFRPSHYLTLER